MRFRVQSARSLGPTEAFSSATSLLEIDHAANTVTTIGNLSEEVPSLENPVGAAIIHTKTSWCSSLKVCCPISDSLFVSHCKAVYKLDYELVCSGNDLLPTDQYTIFAPPCGTSVHENIKYQFYYCGAERHFRKAKYLGIYAEKAIRQSAQFQRSYPVTLISMPSQSK